MQYPWNLKEPKREPRAIPSFESRERLKSGAPLRASPTPEIKMRFTHHQTWNWLRLCGPICEIQSPHISHRIWGAGLSRVDDAISAECLEAGQTWKGFMAVKIWPLFQGFCVSLTAKVWRIYWSFDLQGFLLFRFAFFLLPMNEFIAFILMASLDRVSLDIYMENAEIPQRLGSCDSGGFCECTRAVSWAVKVPLLT